LTAIYVYASTAYMNFKFIRWWVRRFFGSHRWCLPLPNIIYLIPDVW